ncbi:hydroxyphenylacetyl-CoA thioesterase PaaI [Oceanospirillum maris]|jgi:acyl-CoA thioesterase|uniref:hydroxyphenylacetyl-CoA thioesterase PaaI n=1 Tax=Oceanospirillum maris TaxID=64977 RepID=UPI00040757A5|nr:hydroxyphenylacetyl-CoA thioesterase PaaI [Oceanospirillum maris]
MVNSTINTSLDNLTPDELANRCAQKMYESDWAAQALEMTIIDVREGYAKLSMVVRKDMSNGHGICHGGMMFTLADTAFAYSCNSYNKVTVAAGCNIEFIAPGKLGDTLVAEAKKVSLAGRSGIYDVTISNSAGDPIAYFRGKSRQIKGEIISTEATSSSDQ